MSAPLRFKLSRAAGSHIRDVFNLANDPLVRAVSIHQEKIEWPEHRIWFEEKLKNPNCIFYIIETPDDRFAGQIRFDISGAEAVVNISLTEQYRSKGIARPALLQAAALIFQEIQHVNRIIAYIRLDNLNSVNLFERCGFALLKETRIDDGKYFKYALAREYHDLKNR